MGLQKFYEEENEFSRFSRPLGDKDSVFRKYNFCFVNKETPQGMFK